MGREGRKSGDGLKTYKIEISPPEFSPSLESSGVMNFADFISKSELGWIDGALLEWIVVGWILDTGL